MKKGTKLVVGVAVAIGIGLWLRKQWREKTWERLI